MTLCPGARFSSGLSLVELMLVLTISGLLLLAFVQLAGAASAGSRLQDEQSLLQDHARLARRLLVGAIRQAGFSPAPWNSTLSVDAITDSTSDGALNGNDRLVIRSLSDRNCFENMNSVRAADGQPAFFIREIAFDVSSIGYLTRDCRYGPDEANMTRQIRRQGLIPGVETFQLLYADDPDSDGMIDSWVTAGQWHHRSSVRGIRIGVLLAGEHVVTGREARIYRVIDQERTARSDGKLRLSLDITAAIRGRTP